jgi:hypothetical protein
MNIQPWWIFREILLLGPLASGILGKVGVAKQEKMARSRRNELISNESFKHLLFGMEILLPVWL